MTTTDTLAATAAPTKRRFGQSLQQLLVFLSLILLFVFFAIASPFFLSWTNFTSILLAASVTGIMALGATFVIATSGIDLSVGTGMTLCSVMTAVFITNMGMPWWLGILGGLAVGGLLGAVNGGAIAFLRIPPFIATLAMMMVASGLALVISGTKPIYFTSVNLWGSTPFNELATGSIIPGIEFPNGVLIYLIAAVIAGVLLSRSLVGRYALSIGSNEEATEISGINVRKWKLIIYVVAGIFTGLSGVMMAARVNSAQPALGQGYELQAIAAVVIGGTSLQGGKATVLGSVIGALIMAVLTNGLQMMSVPQEWQKVAIGIVILIAVWVDMARRGKDA